MARTTRRGCASLTLVIYQGPCVTRAGSSFVCTGKTNVPEPTSGPPADKEDARCDFTGSD